MEIVEVGWVGRPHSASRRGRPMLCIIYALCLRLPRNCCLLTAFNNYCVL